MTPAYTGERLAQLERRIGRKLTAAETHIQIEQIDETLNRAKDLLHAEIRREQARLAAHIADHGGGGRLEVTARMAAILAGLRDRGRAHALAELHSMGYPVKKGRHLARSEDELLGRLHARLGQLTVKVHDTAVGLDLGTLAADAIERAVMKVLGARSIAADLVAPAFDAGLADTFEQHQDLVEKWQYTAVLDGGTCDPCSSLDGTVYDSWDAISEVLPDGGPNPSCDGGDRCRCRPLPVPPDGEPADRAAPPNDPIDWSTSTATALAEAKDAIAAIETVHGVPPDVPAVSVGINQHLSEGNPGRYTPLVNGKAKIGIARDAIDPGFTMLHEYGHYLSDAAIGTPGVMDAAGLPELADWRAAIDSSQAVQNLRALARGDLQLIATAADGSQVVVPVSVDFIREYLLNWEELFARSYSQWAAVRSGDALLLSQLEQALRGARYPEQWQDHDFAAIAAAFDKLAERLGWTGTP